MIFYRCVNGHRFGINRSACRCMECGSAVSSVWEIPLKCPWTYHPDMYVVRNGLSDVSYVAIKVRGELVAMMGVGKCDSSIVWKHDKNGDMRLFVDRKIVCDTQLWEDFENAKAKLDKGLKNPYALV